MQQAFDPRDFRRVMGCFATGVAVVTTQVGRELHAMTANAVCSVSLEPMMLLVCIQNSLRTLGLLRETGSFAVNFLAQEQEPLSRHFAAIAQPRRPEFRLLPWEGGPRLEGALASLGCRVATMHPAGDHTIVVGRVVALQHNARGREPLVFWSGDYRRLRAADDAAPRPVADEFGGEAVQIYYEA